MSTVYVKKLLRTCLAYKTITRAGYKNIKIKHFLFFFLIAASITCRAEINIVEPSGGYRLPDITKLCDKSANALELSNCFNKAGEDAKLYLKKMGEQIGNRLASRFRPENKLAFDKHLVAWGNYVKATCEFDSMPVYGNSGSAAYAHCTLDFTLAKIRELEKYNIATYGSEWPTYLHLIVSPIRYEN